MQRWEPPTEYSLSDFSVSVTRRVAREREKGRRKKKKKEKRKRRVGSEKKGRTPSPLPEYVSLNLNACLSRFPAFGSSWRWCRATSALIGIWPRSNRARTHVRGTWSHCFSIRVYRWPALVGIDRSFPSRARKPYATILSLSLFGIRRDQGTFKRHREIVEALSEARGK